jgi:hypothetical protein
MAEALPVGMPVGRPEAAAPVGAPDGAPLGRAVALPVGAEQDCVEPELALPEDDEESLDPQAARARGESASRATAGRRRARFMRNSSKNDEDALWRELNQRPLGLPCRRPVLTLCAE